MSIANICLAVWFFIEGLRDFGVAPGIPAWFMGILAFGVVLGLLWDGRGLLRR